MERRLTNLTKVNEFCFYVVAIEKIVIELLFAEYHLLKAIIFQFLKILLGFEIFRAPHRTKIRQLNQKFHTVELKTYLKLRMNFSFLKVMHR